MDVSKCSPESLHVVTDWGLQSLSKQNARFALGYVLGRRALSLVCRSLAVRSLSTQHSGFALGYVLGLRPCPWYFDRWTGPWSIWTLFEQ